MESFDERIAYGFGQIIATSNVLNLSWICQVSKWKIEQIGGSSHDPDVFVASILVKFLLTSGDIILHKGSSYY